MKTIRISMQTQLQTHLIQSDKDISCMQPWFSCPLRLYFYENNNIMTSKNIALWLHFLDIFCIHSLLLWPQIRLCQPWTLIFYKCCEKKILHWHAHGVVNCTSRENLKFRVHEGNLLFCFHPYLLQGQYCNYLKFGFSDAIKRMYATIFSIHITEVVAKKFKNLKHEKSSRDKVLSIGYCSHCPLAMFVVGFFPFFGGYVWNSYTTWDAMINLIHDV